MKRYAVYPGCTVVRSNLFPRHAQASPVIDPLQDFLDFHLFVLLTDSRTRSNCRARAAWRRGRTAANLAEDPPLGALSGSPVPFFGLLALAPLALCRLEPAVSVAFRLQPPTARGQQPELSGDRPGRGGFTLHPVARASLAPGPQYYPQI